MKRLLFAFFLLLRLPVASDIITAQERWHCNPSVSELTAMGFPVLDIRTVGEEEPTYTTVYPPEGAFGIGSRATAVAARMVMVTQEDTLFDSGEYVKGASGMTIKVRGNTSAGGLITPYKIKLQKKADLLLRGDDETFADKDWVLIDGDRLNTILGYEVTKLMGMTWTPAYEIVHVVLNGQLRGVYLLMESVKRNARCRINVSKGSGFIFEQDAYWWNEDTYYKSMANRYYTFKYPDEEDMTQQQFAYICNVIDTMERSFAKGSYEALIDVPSFARWLLTHDIIGSHDSAGSNIFMAKYDDTAESKITMPLLWDLDSSFKYPHLWSSIHLEWGVFPDLFQSPNPAFTLTYIDLWNEKSEYVFEGTDAFLNSFLQSEKFRSLERSRQLMMELFDRDDSTWDEDVRYCIGWFRQRKPWLDAAIQEMSKETGVRTAGSSPTHGDGRAYDLTGRPATGGKQGLVIRNGRKVLHK